MGFFHKKADPISERSRALKAEIAQLEAEIKKLSSIASGNASSAPSDLAPDDAPSHPAESTVLEPIFEETPGRRLAVAPDPITTPEYFNDLGVRKYDLPAFLRRMRNSFRGAPAANPRLVTFLAAGSIQGLRPLRYEKRVARNRFLCLSVVLLLMLWGLAAALIRNQ